ncbi:hypothetical protein SISNIDRAFT_462990, partial [Sistotremastrum niveocremeum HHB9708]
MPRDSSSPVSPLRLSPLSRRRLLIRRAPPAVDHEVMKVGGVVSPPPALSPLSRRRCLIRRATVVPVDDVFPHHVIPTTSNTSSSFTDESTTSSASEDSVQQSTRRTIDGEDNESIADLVAETGPLASPQDHGLFVPPSPVKSNDNTLSISSLLESLGTEIAALTMRNCELAQE